MLDMSAYFGLSTNPFSGEADLVDGASFARALEELLARLREGSRLVVIEGESGSGRTRLMRRAALRIADEGRTARLVQHAQMPATGRDADIVFIDEARGVSSRELAAHLGRAEQTGTTSVVMSLGPEEARALPRAVQPIALAPLSEVESERFIVEHIERAGGRGDLFTPPALAAIVDFAKGSPRRLRLVTGLAMVEAALDGAARVEEVHARATIKRLPVGIPVPIPGLAIGHGKASEAAGPPVPSQPSLAPPRIAPSQTSKSGRRRPAFRLLKPVWREAIGRTGARSRQLTPWLAGTAALVAVAALPFRHMIPSVGHRVAPDPIIVAHAEPTHRPPTVSSVAPPALPPVVAEITAPAAREIPVAVAQPKPAVSIPRASVLESAAMAAVDGRPTPMPETNALDAANGPPTPAQSTLETRVRVFIHHAPGDADAAAEVARSLAERGWNVAELRPVHVRVNHPSARFFYAGDGAAARELSAELTPQMSEPIKVRDMRSYVRPPRPGTLEIWLRTGGQLN